MTLHRVLACLLLVLALPCADGAAAASKEKKAARDDAQSRAELQAAVMRFSDHFASRLVEGFSEVEEQGPSSEVWNTTFADLLFGTQAAYTIAADPDPGIAVLDLVVLVSLGRIAYEEDRVPRFGEQVAPMGKAFRSLEPEIWTIASKLLTTQQQADLRAMIEEFRASDPELKSFSFAFVRFGDFSGLKKDSSLTKAARGGLFGSMKQAVHEIDQIRDLAERGMFVATRMPLLSQAYVELVYMQALNKPEMRTLLGNVDQITDVMVQVPDLITSEREIILNDLMQKVSTLTEETIDETLNRVTIERRNTIDQVFNRVATERQAVFDLVVAEEQPVRGVLSDLNQTVTGANELVVSVNALAARFVPERPPGWQPEPSEPLDIQEVRGALADVNGLLEKTNGIVRSVDGLMASPNWEERLPQFMQVIDQAEDEVEALTTRVFLQAVALLVIFFLLLLGYRYASLRLIPARRPD